jgi:hypothetical protein
MWDSCDDNAVERQYFVVAAVGAAFGAGAVVSHDVEQQRVVQLAHALERVHQTTHFMVGVLPEGGEYFHLASK